MARPRHEYPTPAELEVLEILWERGPLTVREVLEALGSRRKRAYTSVMSLLNVMTEKKLVSRRARGRAFIYRPRVRRDRTVGRMVRDLLQRAFKGSSSALIASMLDQSPPSAEELEAIRATIEAYRGTKGAP